MSSANVEKRQAIVRLLSETQRVRGRREPPLGTVGREMVACNRHKTIFGTGLIVEERSVSRERNGERYETFYPADTPPRAGSNRLR